MLLSSCIPDMLKRCFPLVRRGSTASRRTVGDVGHPQPVELKDAKVPLDQIGRQNYLFPRCRGSHEASARDPSQPRQAHQPRHALATDVNVVLQGELGVDARNSVALLREAVDGVNLRGQPHVLQGALTGWPMTPSVITARRDSEQSAHDPYPVGGLICLYESVERFVFGALSWAVGSRTGAPG